MGVTRADLFTDEQNELASYARVLAHPARIAIIQHLLSTNTCCNSTLVGDLGLAQATISQHLRELKDIGIIQGTVEGVSVNYCINPEKWSHIKEMLFELLESYNPTRYPSC
ncbi:MAG: metalloregulator ArsR/SmtB family transcription factor [Balneolales bacterium]|nr:metalloregulator ArsR/SmtB family transcription factor [Balneolales bacterium]